MQSNDPYDELVEELISKLRDKEPFREAYFELLNHNFTSTLNYAIVKGILSGKLVLLYPTKAGD